MLLLCIRSYLKSVLGYKFLILDTCHADTTFASARMWGSVVIIRSQTGSASNMFEQQWYGPLRIIQPPLPLYKHDSSRKEYDKPNLGLGLHILTICGYNDTTAGPQNICMQNRNRIIQIVLLTSTSLGMHPSHPALPRAGRMTYGRSMAKGLRNFWCATVPCQTVWTV
jgi:hypothetical protein